MEITKDKKRTILSLTPKEVEELEMIISFADRDCEGLPTSKDDAEEIKENKKAVEALRKWCKAFGLNSNAHLLYEEW